MRAIREMNGFTLIELLIVVAIIAILAAIAVPNFLEAQVRAKISRSDVDIRSLATALESYAVDHSKYPPRMGDGTVWGWSIEALFRLTTPVAFLSSLPRDPFNDATVDQLDRESGGFSYYDRGSSDPFGVITWAGTESYFDWAHGPLPGADSPSSKEWMLKGFGPDRGNNWDFIDEDLHEDPPLENTPHDQKLVYDSTNGTISYGDVYRWGP